MSAPVYQKTVSAPVNIAVIKYWGKRDVGLNLPSNSSLSVTLSQNDLRTLTTASCSAAFEEDSLWLNGAMESMCESPRLSVCVRELRKSRLELEAKNESLEKIANYKLRVVSENNFPTAAGLASSAAGFAAFAQAICALYELPWTPTELSRVARQGSGSACRSLFGGYVSWEMGEQPTGADSVAVQVAPVEHWPEMRVAILVVSAAKKGVSSTAGMQATVATSSLFAERARNVVPQRMVEMKNAIRARDFASFAQLTMKDSNQFHAVCLDTTPPIFYLNDTSRAIIRAVESINSSVNGYAAAYTFDAGPNAVIYFLEKDSDLVLTTLRSVTQNAEGWEKADFKPVESSEFLNLEPTVIDTISSGVSRVILTRVGDGPQVLPDTESLVDTQGNPKL
ncbi:diphosphomevalonate decarboxylase [Schizosaccharomyces japonicus yFS275]|uniref:Diphosphomevalonate decarboxylase n=1 Tax=Schizosaccharomyces japonicus (strain yFS275 / FY16936) TaxID=402676 RepID=B6K402_SCHJY|nr:diphosphomevalonate decarboxylase [Schizosaccharomyces japonicus yFS275]EEB08209.2 diphosphomevalonate decarboxylase [Schizosaccharomyces japonicus yFS275]